ncbi:hypothetical protein [Amycolatopsis arida]|uniref:WYL domain-containing protein n=1 Tax=Amycolatopsis arida TaxID=587909 RepID=UPI00312C7C97
MEPHRLVADRRRWYLVGYDDDRGRHAACPGRGRGRPDRRHPGRHRAARRPHLPAARAHGHAGVVGVPADPARVRVRGARAAGARRLPDGTGPPGAVRGGNP